MKKSRAKRKRSEDRGRALIVLIMALASLLPLAGYRPPTRKAVTVSCLIIAGAPRLALGEKTPASPQCPANLLFLAGQKFDLNRASSRDLEYLPGVGPGYAAKIVARRQSLGGFDESCRLEDLQGLPAHVKKALSKYTRCGKVETK